MREREPRDEPEREGRERDAARDRRGPRGQRAPLTRAQQREREQHRELRLHRQQTEADSGVHRAAVQRKQAGAGEQRGEEAGLPGDHREERAGKRERAQPRGIALHDRADRCREQPIRGPEPQHERQRVRQPAERQHEQQHGRRIEPRERAVREIHRRNRELLDREQRGEMPCIGRVPVRGEPRRAPDRREIRRQRFRCAVVRQDHAERIDADEQQFRHQHGGRIKAHAFAIEPVRIAARPAIGSSGCTSVAACAWRANEGAFMAWSVTRRPRDARRRAAPRAARPARSEAASSTG